MYSVTYYYYTLHLNNEMIIIIIIPITDIDCILRNIRILFYNYLIYKLPRRLRPWTCHRGRGGDNRWALSDECQCYQKWGLGG